MTIVPGMPVCGLTDGVPIIRLTQAYCLYRLEDNETLCVANWRDVALGGSAVVPSDVKESDYRNAERDGVA